jgi:hypothetical protein
MRTLRARVVVATLVSVTKIEELEHMVDGLRRQRNDCEPKSNQNPRYLRYSNAVSALLWIIDDLRAQEPG